MRTTDSAGLLLLISSAIAACGDATTPPSSADAGSADAAPLEAGTGGAVDAAADVAATDAAVPEDASADASSPPTVRRPFLVGASLRAAAPAARRDWLADIEAPDALSPIAAIAAMSPATVHRLAAVWLKDALEEHASIAAFARFTMHLLALGAPPDLVADSQRASLDEIHHARACFALALRYGALIRGPGALPLGGAVADASLVEVASLAAEEGCVGETLGAVLAREQLAVARDPVVVKALRKIARDEARHAELSWRFVRWAVLTGGDPVRDAVASRVERAVASTLAMPIRSYAGVDLAAWHAHGRLTCSESRDVAAAASLDVIAPSLAAALAPAA